MNTYTFKEIEVSQKVNFIYELNEEKMEMFKKITGDENPLHNDLQYAMDSGYPEKVVYGMLTSAILSTLAGMYLPGQYSLIHKIEINYLKPVFISKCPLQVEAEVIEKDDRFQIIKIKYLIKDSENNKVSKGTMQIGFTNKN